MTALKTTTLKMNMLKKSALLLSALLTFSAQAAPAPAPQTVTLALDWVPNVNHIGVYVALARGWYAAAGVKLRVLPYGSTAPEVLVNAGRADIGVSSAEGVTAAAAAGQPLVSVAAIWTTDTAAFAVLKKSGILRPRDLDGKIYAAFGAPYERPIITRLIRADGGKGVFRSPVLGTGGLDALLSGRADFVWIFQGVEGVQAQRRGLPLRSFSLTRYGVPDYYTPVFVADRRRLAADHTKLQAFMSATARGYEFARTHPDEAAALMLRAAPRNTFPDPQVLTLGARYFTAHGAYERAGSSWGQQTLPMWTAYPSFLLRAGAVKKPDGSAATHLDFASLFTNELLRP